MPTFYDQIGGHYSVTRGEDPRIASRIHAALGTAATVVNVGAGTGSYEPHDRRVVAVEPSRVMVAQRPAGTAPAVRAVAEALPFRTGSFEAAMAVLTIQHWTDRSAGIAEMQRVAKRIVVIFTWDPEVGGSYWLRTDYFPTSGRLDAERYRPIPALVHELGGAEVLPVPIPWDCRDGFYGAFWRRPRAILDPAVWRSVSSLRLISDEERETGMQRLSNDLDSGEWERRYRRLLNLDELDLGYRLVVARLS